MDILKYTIITLVIYGRVQCRQDKQSGLTKNVICHLGAQVCELLCIHCMYGGALLQFRISKQYSCGDAIILFFSHYTCTVDNKYKWSVMKNALFMNQ